MNENGQGFARALTAMLVDVSCLERDIFTRESAHALDRLLSRLAAVQRYRIIRKYVRGTVVDAACGTGYGSWLLSKCPAAKRVVGIEIDHETVVAAQREFPECEFVEADLTSKMFADLLLELRPDTVVSVETIEHLYDAPTFLKAVVDSGASRFIVTFPSFETVTFNPWHVRDWTLAEVSELLEADPTVAFVIDDAVQLAVYDL